MDKNAGWKAGPLPSNTYFWGGVVPVGEEASGFYFADFCGSTVKILTGLPGERVLTSKEVAWYNNSLELPPCCDAGVGKRL